MSYAGNIGRIGTLAVALGVGYGVDPAVAFASDSDRTRHRSGPRTAMNEFWNTAGTTCSGSAVI